MRPQPSGGPIPQAGPRIQLARTWDVLRALAVSDLLVRYGRGPFRAARWLAEPFAAAGVYLLLIAFVLDRPGEAPGLTIACAVVPFQLLVTTVTNALTGVQNRGMILANLAFPRMLIPIASTVTETIAFTASLALLAVMMAVYAVAPTAAVLWLPLVIALTFVFAVALAYPATLIGVWFPELNRFVLSAVRALFFVAPGVVALDEIRGRAHDWLQFNPLTGIFEATRDVLLRGESPAAWDLFYPLTVAVVLLAVFVPLYAREQLHFAKLLQ